MREGQLTRGQISESEVSVRVVWGVAIREEENRAPRSNKTQMWMSLRVTRTLRCALQSSRGTEVTQRTSGAGEGSWKGISLFYNGVCLI